jgi:hypothetical protein
MSKTLLVFKHGVEDVWVRYSYILEATVESYVCVIEYDSVKSVIDLMYLLTQSIVTCRVFA